MSKKIILVIGSGGVGKTTLIRTLLVECEWMNITNRNFIENDQDKISSLFEHGTICNTLHSITSNNITYYFISTIGITSENETNVLDVYSSIITTIQENNIEEISLIVVSRVNDIRKSKTLLDLTKFVKLFKPNNMSNFYTSIALVFTYCNVDTKELENDKHSFRTLLIQELFLETIQTFYIDARNPIKVNELKTFIINSLGFPVINVVALQNKIYNLSNCLVELHKKCIKFNKSKRRNRKCYE